MSLGAVNSNHRVTRRKSIASAAAANAAAAVAATMKDSGDPVGVPMASHRRSLAGRKGLESSSLGATSALSSSLSRSMNAGADRKTSPNAIDENAAVDGNASVGKPVSTKSRNRRASEGSNLNRGEGKRVASELRCERCGKGWEHDPAWQYTSKLLISKHQQVQLLEAATVLVNMNQEPTASAPEMESEDSSASPATSSELRDGLSSTETTPPPMGDDGADLTGTPAGYGKRYSVASTSAFSRSYQSSSFADSAPLHSPAFSHFRHSSIDTRPSTADTGSSDDDEADLAAAIGLCNFGTPRTGPVPMSPDVPPVPPLPARFLGQSISGPGLSQSAAAAMPLPSSASTIYGSLSLNPSLSYKVSDERDVKMEDAHRESRQRRNADVDFGSRHQEDDDDGVFGHMEE
ncbi:hypothetical protein Plec18167_009562 [Paecilomyces lecythidis]|uniref:C2H2-type domain-containing protein n=1 Tax=Paecilomyces lecythidis TaxID=3004212 RepID=A0ABR3WND8_9EURO